MFDTTYVVHHMMYFSYFYVFVSFDRGCIIYIFPSTYFRGLYTIIDSLRQFTSLVPIDNCKFFTTVIRLIRISYVYRMSYQYCDESVVSMIVEHLKINVFLKYIIDCLTIPLSRDLIVHIFSYLYSLWWMYKYFHLFIYFFLYQRFLTTHYKYTL